MVNEVFIYDNIMQQRPKPVIIMRHAKASQDPQWTDLERPLTKQGVHHATQQAKRIYGWIHEHNIVECAGFSEQYILTSHAARAYQTAQIVAEQFGLPLHHILVDPALYLCSASVYIDRYRYHTTQGCTILMIVGHNNGISMVARSKKLRTADALLLGYQTNAPLFLREMEKDV